MLKLAIYLKDGHIERVHELKNGKDYVEAIKEVNRKNANTGRCVEARDYTDDSIEAYLYRTKALRKKDFMDQLYEICHYMNDLDDRLSWLREQIEQMEEADHEQ